MTNENEVFKAAINHWGIDLQMDQAIEECAELIVAIRHFKRGRTNRLPKLIEEMVDADICLKQLKLMVNDDDYKTQYAATLLRLKNRIENAQGLVDPSCGKDFKGDSV